MGASVDQEEDGNLHLDWEIGHSHNQSVHAAEHG